MCFKLSHHAHQGPELLCRCLQTHLDQPGMSSECRAEVERDQQQSATDYRLNYRLKEACMDDVKAHCRDLAHTCSLEKGCRCGVDSPPRSRACMLGLVF